MMTTPLVSVILIGYNDASRIPKALESIRSQSLHAIEIIVVDDASIDSTAEIVQEAAAKDARIRFIRRSENSGGCSAPRNDGLAAASAPWVMFCDSDDELERHACATLVNAAEDWNADLVCGTAIRHDVKKDRDKRWRPELHSHDRVVSSLAEDPQLLYDTISVNKIYRRSFLLDNDIMFPPGLLFEDQVFTLKCFLKATRIGILQAVVYIWNVDRQADEASITQGRMQPRNVLDRIEVNRLMDSLLVDSTEELRLEKAIKFLRHEGYLYMSAFGENPDQAAATSAAIAFADYAKTVDVRAFDSVRPALKVAFYGLLTGDWELMRRAMRWERWASVVDTAISHEVRDGRHVTYWRPPTDSAMLGRTERDWLDVSHLHLAAMPFETRRYFHELTHLVVHRSRTEVEIQTTDYASDLNSDVDAHMVFADRVGTVIASLPLERCDDVVDGRIRWRGSGVVEAHIQRPLMRPDRGTVSIRLALRQSDSDLSLVNLTAVRSSLPEVSEAFVSIPGVGFADRPAGAQLGVGERASVTWKPAGRAKGPVAWGRRLGHATRRRLPGASEELYRARRALLPGPVTWPRDRPTVAYVPAPQTGDAPLERRWPLDLSAWDLAMADVCYLAVAGEVAESVPTRLWGSVRDARALPLGEVLEAAALVITDDPALIDIVGPSIVFRPDEGAARYLLPELPVGYPVVTDLEGLASAVRIQLERVQ